MRIKKSDLSKLIKECMVDMLPMSGMMPSKMDQYTDKNMSKQDLQNLPNEIIKIFQMPRHTGDEWDPEAAEDDGRMLDYGDDKSDSDEGYMAKAQLDYISTVAQDLEDMLYDGDDLPQWCQTEIAIAKDKIGKVYDYLVYKIKRRGMEK
jgi:hypothetical protein